jgi:phage repressor protein C with HTH and peptisase S24 domain
MESYGERLKQLRHSVGLTQEALAEKIGNISKTTIHRIEHQTISPSARDVFKICRYFNVYMEWFMTGKGRKFRQPIIALTDEDKQLLRKFNQLGRLDRGRALERIQTMLDAQKTRAEEARVTMKVYDVSASAGMGFYMDNESTYEFLSFEENEVPPDAEYGMRISGVSMEPTIEDGSIIWVKPQEVLHLGQVGIFIHNNELLCKEFAVHPARGHIQLLSHHPDYPPVNVTEDDSFRIMGLALL